MRRILFAFAVICLFGSSVVSAQSMRAPRAPEFGIAPAPAVVNGRLAVTDGFEPVAAAFLQASVTNPSTAAFTASTDQSTTSNGVALLTSYVVEVYGATSGTLAKSQDIGKPTPDASNIITYSQLQTVLASVAPGDYVAKVAAVGPGGTSRSAASNPFTVAVRAPNASGTPVVR